MILPSKHVKLSNSLLNLGAILLSSLNDKYTVTMLWDRTRRLPEVRTFEKFILGLDFLFALNLIEFQEGLIKKVTK